VDPHTLPAVHGAASALAARRARLGHLLGDQAALLAAGTPRPRNYAANTYPFRAGSHFLYLFGLHARGAFGLWSKGEWTLFLPDPDPTAVLWHGPQPSGADIAAALGCSVRSVSALAGHLAGREVATLPAPDLETCAAQARLLGRPINPGHFAENDGRLADAMIALRLVHDDAAIAELRAAAQATRAAHHAGMKATRPGLRESQVRAAMEAELVARGMTVAYGSIVTVHGEILHSEHHGHLLADGDLLLADVGAETAGGWAGDVTRTWPVRGRYSASQRDLYDVVLAAQKETIAAVAPNVRYRDLHQLALRAIGRGLVALGILRGDVEELVADGVVTLFFPHGIGHLLGLDVHDMEDLGDRAGYASGRQRAADFGLRYLRLDRDLAAGMAVTIEPGIYLVPSILEDPALAGRARDRLDRARLDAFRDVRGIRIEDDVLITGSGHEVLTAAIPKERQAIEDLMR
jgi:Xaa-Pro aminopeptidase